MIMLGDAYRIDDQVSRALDCYEAFLNRSLSLVKRKPHAGARETWDVCICIRSAAQAYGVAQRRPGLAGIRSKTRNVLDSVDGPGRLEDVKLLEGFASATFEFSSQPSERRLALELLEEANNRLTDSLNAGRYNKRIELMLRRTEVYVLYRTSADINREDLLAKADFVKRESKGHLPRMASQMDQVAEQLAPTTPERIHSPSRAM